MNPLNLKSKLIYGSPRPLTKETNTVRYNDPEEVMVGECMSCKTHVTCLRMDTVSKAPKYGDAFPEPGIWQDLLRAECPTCGACVFVMAAQDFKKAKKDAV